MDRLKAQKDLWFLDDCLSWQNTHHKKNHIIETMTAMYKKINQKKYCWNNKPTRLLVCYQERTIINEWYAYNPIQLRFYCTAKTTRQVNKDLTSRRIPLWQCWNALKAIYVGVNCINLQLVFNGTWLFWKIQRCSLYVLCTQF